MNNSKSTENENSKLPILATGYIAMFFLIGVLVGERSKGSFFRPWYNDGHLYVGDEVRFKKDAKYADIYNSCQKMTIIGLRATSNNNVAWILMEKCSAFSTESWGSIDTDVVSQDWLEKAGK